MRLILVFLFILLVTPSYAYELYLVRHFEKQSQQQDPELTEEGLKRAQSLVNLLANKDIAVVYSTSYRRTQQTASPSAQALGLDITSYSPSDLPAFAQQLKRNKQNALVVGHSNTTPALISHLGGKAKKIAEYEYGELFVLIMLDGKVVTQSVIVGK